jgi:4-hydroxy-3-methylbut-2-enyl diphosphate reductase
MVDSAAQLKPEWIEGKQRIGLTAGASAPENLVTDVIARLYGLGAKRVTQLPGRDENVVFALPRELGTVR